MTKCLYFIIGSPIVQARSPEVFNARFLQSGLDAEMLPLEVSPTDFADVIAGLSKTRNLGGVIVTIPHKPTAAKLASNSFETRGDRRRGQRHALDRTRLGR